MTDYVLDNGSGVHQSDISLWWTPEAVKTGEANG